MPEKKLIRILSIDGGGIRGILPGQIVVELERRLQEKTNNPDARIADYFDMIAGTSTGGILTCLYLTPDLNNANRPRFSAKQAVDFYMRYGGEIFSNTLWDRIRSFTGTLDEKYSAEPLEERLHEFMGDLKLSQLLRPCLISAYDISKRRAIFFTQHEARQDTDPDFWVRDVARATSAAPSYFEPALVRSLSEVSYPLIDGGVYVNNPAMCALVEGFKAFSKPGNKSKLNFDDFFILSIGTGSIKKKYLYEEAQNWGQLGWIKPLIDIMMSGVAETVDYQLRKLYSNLNMRNQYVRISPELGDASSEMDDASPENLRNLYEAGKFYAHENYEIINRIADTLIANQPDEVC